jgi:hypothetical protein
MEIRVFKERGKVNQVTHWDLDYLSKDEVRELYERRPDDFRRRDKKGLESRKPNQKLALLLITIGLLLLAGSLYVASII